MDKKQPDKFKRWMIASFFLIPLLLFGSIAGYYHLHFPIKMWVLICLLGYDRTSSWAWERIHNQGKRAVPYVIKGLWSENEEVRLTSEAILRNLAGGVKDDRLAARLIKLLSHPNARVRAGAATGLGVFRDKAAVPALTKLLSDPEVLVRSSAARALGEVGDERAVSRLIDLLSDPDSGVRCSVAYALGNIGDNRGVPALIKVLSESNIFVRMSAIFALGEIGAEEAAGPLIGCLSPKARWGMAFPEYEPAVIESLQKITGENFGSVWRNTPRPILEETIQKWLKWWEENKEKYEAEAATETADSADDETADSADKNNRRLPASGGKRTK